MSSAAQRKAARFQAKIAGDARLSGHGTTSGPSGPSGPSLHPERSLEATFKLTRFVAWDGESVTVPPDPVLLEELEDDVYRAEMAIAALKEAIGSDPVAGGWRDRRRGQLFADRGGLDEREFAAALERHGNLRQELAAERRQLRRRRLDLERHRISTHSYVLLMSSAGDELMQTAGKPLTTRECLDVLCDAAERQPPHTVNVAYGGNYDVVKILSDLPRRDVETLWNRPTIERDGKRVVQKVYWRPRPGPFDPDPLFYRIEYTPKSNLTVARQAPERWRKGKDGKYLLGPNGYPLKAWGKSMVLWDVVKAFQCRFTEAVEEWLGPVPELEMVKAQKLKRSSFSVEELETEIVPYTRVEVELLVRVMDRLRDALDAAGIRVSRWDGVGAMASALMRREGVPAHMPREATRGAGRHVETLPEPVQEAAQHAYFGGRIELLKYGRIAGPIHHYDVNSAYPSVYPHLPSLAPSAGSWRHGGPHDRREPFSVSRVRWRAHEGMTTRWLFPFPFRDTVGQILFPAALGAWLEGWYWRPEVDAALELSDLGMEILETWSWEADPSAERPFGYVQALYDRRMEIGKKTGEGRAIKLALNAHSGKTAQSAGWQTSGHVPSLHCTPWAGYINSWTRAQLYRAAMQAPDQVVAISTDGVWSLAPLDVPVSTRLGDWEYATHDELVAAQSGVYWTRDGERWRVHCRGYDLEDWRSGEPAVTREAVLQAWEDGRDLPAWCTRFIGFGSALAGPRQWARRGTFWTAERVLQLNPRGTKRMTAPGRWRPHLEAVPTLPREPGEVLTSPEGLMSKIYPLGWQTAPEEFGVREREDGVGAWTWVQEVEDAQGR